MEHVRIHITGIVQGVGFRPFVYREAAAAGVTGWVLNAADGVHIEAHAEHDALERFVGSLRGHAPAAARIDKIAVETLDEDDCVHGQGDRLSPEGDASPREFRIIASDDTGARTTLVSPDIATCPDCLRELFDPTDRRYRYPFINCTNCGPRYTIIRSLPYDRRNTSMDVFPMCPECAAEYRDPLDRRFHAQPDACFACGPHLTWRERTMTTAVNSALSEKRPDIGERGGDVLVGRTRAESDAIIARAVALIGHGGVLAIKGLGGFHLACDAGNEEAVAELRRRKRRSNKPLAVMVADLSDAESLCHIGDTERELLAGTVRPIVLLRRRADAGESAPAGKPQPAGAPGATGAPARITIAPNVAGDLPELGIMLPYTPLQHLLLADCRAAGVHALVMTSGNVSEEPIECDDALAWRHLVESGIADALLGNDRAILSRFDDSVVRVVAGRTQMVRRARGYAPRPVALPVRALPKTGSNAGGTGAPAVLACGPEQKATLALVREDESGAAECFVSQHIGDLENAETFDAWQETRRRMEGLFDIRPAAIACDRHPGYLSSQWARAEAAAKGLPLIEVQHHHAHIASVIAEAAARGEIAPDSPVVGIALDGTGAGDDGSVWGGEILVATIARYERAAHLRAWRLPGGAASVRDARRNAYSLLLEYGLLDHPGAQRLLADMTEQERALTRQMVERGLNSPRTSSMGRLLDAVAALFGVRDRATYEGEPAIELEAAAARWLGTRRIDRQLQAPSDPAFRANTSDAKQEDGGIIDLADLLRTLLDGVVAGTDPGELAWRAHVAIAHIVVERALAIAHERKIRVTALSGGCFMNRLLLEQVKSALERAGMTVLLPRELPVNDGCIAYGQAAVARAQLAR